VQVLRATSASTRAPGASNGGSHWVGVVVLFGLTLPVDQCCQRDLARAPSLRTAKKKPAGVFGGGVALVFASSAALLRTSSARISSDETSRAV